MDGKLNNADMVDGITVCLVIDFSVSLFSEKLMDLLRLSTAIPLSFSPFL